MFLCFRRKSFLLGLLMLVSGLDFFNMLLTLSSKGYLLFRLFYVLRCLFLGGVLNCLILNLMQEDNLILEIDKVVSTRVLSDIIG